MTVLSRLSLGPLIAAAMATTCCNPGGSHADDNAALRVVATVGMIGDVAAEIGGDKVLVSTLIGPGVDPHLYKPTVADVKLLDAADVIFQNGLMLEGRMGDTLRKMGKRGKTVHAVAEEALDEEKRLVSDDKNHHDPHLWMDVAAWTQVATRIAQVLSIADQENAAFYQERKLAYQEQLGKLDTYARETLATIPAEWRVLITAHDAFGYLARAYGLEVRGVQGISTESEAGLKEINALVDFLVERKVPAVFIESSVSTKAVEALIEGARSKGHSVRIGGELFSDAMGHRGTYEGTYLGMIDHNVTTIARALGGEAPESGMNGKLTKP